MATMIAELHAVADTTLVPTYTDPIELSQAMQGLHMRDMLGYDDGAEENGVDKITRMVQHNLNHDYRHSYSKRECCRFWNQHFNSRYQQGGFFLQSLLQSYTAQIITHSKGDMKSLIYITASNPRVYICIL